MTPEPAAGAARRRVGHYTVDLVARQVLLGSDVVELQWRQFEALRLLMEANGEPVERERLLEALWPGVNVEEASLNQCISQLRKALNDTPETGLIQTVPRRGYRLGATLRPAELPVERPAVARPARAWSIRARMTVAAGLVVLTIIVGWTGRRLIRNYRAETLVTEGLALVRLNQYQQVAAGNALLRQALEISPDSAMAYAGLAEGMARSSQDRPGQARDLALKALELDPSCARCLAIAGWVLMSKEWQWRQAMDYLSRASERIPDDARVRMWHAQILAVDGKLDEARRAVNAAVGMRPGEATAITMHAGILYLSQSYDDAIVTARKALALQPSYPSALNWLYRTYGVQRHFEEALAALSAQRRAFTGMSQEREYEQTQQWHATLRKDGLEAWVRRQLEIESSQPAKDTMRYEHATWRMWIGDRNGALEELDSLFTLRPYDAMYVAVDPVFAPLRGEPRFHKVLERMGLLTGNAPAAQPR